MTNPPKTKEEAARYRYGSWRVAPRGYEYSPARCAYEVHHDPRFHQCERANGHGPDGLYCKQHAKIVESFE